MSYKMSSVLRGVKDAPVSNAAYVVRMDVQNYAIGSTQATINAGIAAAKADGQTVNVVGNVIDLSPSVYLADYFNGDVTLNGGDLLRDMGRDLVLTYQGNTFLRGRLVSLVQGRNTQGLNFSAPFYVTIWESYGAGGAPNGHGGYTSDVFVSRAS
jgi:hypothetical protein